MISQPPASAYLAVVSAAALWGTLGVAYELILRTGEVEPLTLVSLRMLTAVIVLIGYVALQYPRLLVVPRAALPTLLAIGVVSFALFYVSLIYAFRWSSVPVATVLLYTAPAWVAAGERLFLGYRLNRASVIAVCCAVAGSALVADLLHAASGGFSLRGVAIGLFAAITYASYSILGKRALTMVPPVTVLVYGTAIGAACVIPVTLLVDGVSMPSAGVLAEIVLWPGIAVTVIPIALYTHGLRALRPSTANIIATLEPVVAIALSAAILDQRLGPAQIAGALLIIAGVLSLSLRPDGRRTRTKKPTGMSPVG